MGSKDKENLKNPPSSLRGKLRFGTLEIASFVCGAAVMVLEMAGSRVVAPYVGTTVIVWTALIGVIMASLCVGYWFGGIVADRRPEVRILARIVLFSSLLTGGMALIANPVLAFLASSITSVPLACILGALILFAPPSFLLGMVSPFIVRLAMLDVDSAGSTVGRFSALSSAGSILGTFLGGFVFISLFASGTILLLVATVLALVALMLYRSLWKKAFLISLGFLALTVSTRVWGMPMMPVGEHIETPYNHIWVVERMRSSGRRVRIMMTDPNGAQSLIYTDNPNELVSDYTKFYDLAFYYKPNTSKILMLGGGGYCVPRHVMATRQNVQMDVVELDKGITETAQKYFDLRDYPGLSINHEDARSFLNRSAANPKMIGTYDAIFGDVFGSWYSIPFHLATVEATQKMYDLLAPDGILVSNVISSLYGPKSGVFQGIYAAVSSVFPRVLIFPATAPDPKYASSRQNLMIVAFKSSDDIPVLPPYNPETAALLSHRWNLPFTPTVPAFTDAFAPVERYSLME